MRGLSEVRERLRSLFFRSREDAEMDEELQFHLAMETEKNMRAGMSPQEARRQARIAFGAVERVREQVREARGLGWLGVVARDVRYALRGLRLNPLFSVTLVFTLALGIGATAAMFSIVDALILRPLPYRNPDQLVDVSARTPKGNTRPYVSWDDAQTWREQVTIFQGTMSYTTRSLLFTGGAEPRTVGATGVTADFEEVLGGRPVLGRGFYREDADPAALPVVLLEHTFWRTAFGGDAAIIDRMIELNGTNHRIVGVMPEGFKFPAYSTRELWAPIRTDGTFLGQPVERLSLVGRIGAEPIERVQQRADALAAALAEAQPREQGWAIQLQSIGRLRTSNSELQQAVRLLAGAVLLLLLVAAVNAASLLLVRGWSRAPEFAIRVALGASRRRVMAQLVTESVLFAMLSGIAACVLALVVLKTMRGIIPESITFFAPYAIELEWRALVFTFVVAAVLGVLIGVVPALRATYMGSGTGPTPSFARNAVRSRLRRGLVIGEVALSVVLLIGAGLLINSFMRLVSADPGFRIENLAVMKLNLSQASYPSPAARASFLRQLEQRLEALPGVEGVALNGGVPPSGGFHFGVNVMAEGEQPNAEGQPQLLPFASVPPDFFQVLETPIVAGRAFIPEDAGTDHVIVDRSLAQFLWAKTNPVGRRFRVGPESEWLTVVGVVAPLKWMGPDDRSSPFGLLYPLGPDEAPEYLPLAIRTQGDPRSLLPAFRAAVHELDPKQPVEELRPAIEFYAETIDMPRFLLVLMGVLSGLGLLLAAVGIYGTLAFGVVQRRRELGIRIALGAPLKRISWGVLQEGLLLAGVGAAAGTIGALALSELIRGLLFNVEPTDPTTIGAVVLVSLAAASAACYWPARRATRVDPVEVLKAE